MIYQDYIPDFYVIHGERYAAVYFLEYLNGGEPPKLTAQRIWGWISNVIMSPIYLKRLIFA